MVLANSLVAYFEDFKHNLHFCAFSKHRDYPPEAFLFFFLVARNDKIKEYRKKKKNNGRFQMSMERYFSMQQDLFMGVSTSRVLRTAFAYIITVI